MLDLAAKMTNYELMPQEGRLWAETLSRHPAEAIEWAFIEYLKVGQFFPKPAEILERIATWHRQWPPQE